MENDLFSIVIPCRNEEAFIGNTLQSIWAQNILTPSTPVYIADAGSTDNTLQVIDSFRPYLNVQVIPGGLPPAARNKGASLCRTKYILFMDSDIELGRSDTLFKVLTTAEKNKLELVIPLIRIRQANWLDKVFEYSYYLAARYKVVGSFGTGMFIFIRTETFRALGGFNERLPLGDDWELSHRIQPDHFGLADTFVYTSNRRFIAQGYLATFYQWASVAFRKKYRENGHVEYFDKAYLPLKNKSGFNFH